MIERIRVRLISLIEDAGNSLEQLETLTNRFLDDFTHDMIDAVEMKVVSREVMDEDGELLTETDHIMYIRYRVIID